MCTWHVKSHAFCRPSLPSRSLRRLGAPIFFSPYRGLAPPAMCLSSSGLLNSVRCAHINEPHKLLFVGLSTKNFNRANRVGGFRPLTHHRTCHLWHTAVSRRVIGPGTNVPAATLLSLLAGYPVNSSALLRGFELAPLSIFQSRLRTFQYFLALLL